MKKMIKGQSELLGVIATMTTKYYEKLSVTTRKKTNLYKLSYW